MGSNIIPTLQEETETQRFWSHAKDYNNSKWQIADRTETQVCQTPAPTAIMLHWTGCPFGYILKFTFP